MNIPSDDYYKLLGVPVDCDDATLRRTWRKLALRWHPDRAGPKATALFQDLSAAYAVLSDPAARAAYDRKRGIEPGTVAKPVERPPSQPSRPRAPSVMLSRLTGALNTLVMLHVARRAEPGLIELYLHEEEARDGGMATISMPVPIRCPLCADEPTSDCAKCDGKGWVEELFSAWLAIPPGCEDGEILEPSAQLRGVLKPVRFRARVRE